MPNFLLSILHRMFLSVQLRWGARCSVFCFRWVSQTAPCRESSRQHVNSVIILRHWCEYFVIAYADGGLFQLTMTRTAIGRLENPRFGMGRMAIARHMRLYTSTRYKTTIKKKKKKKKSCYRVREQRFHKTGNIRIRTYGPIPNRSSCECARLVAVNAFGHFQFIAAVKSCSGPIPNYKWGRRGTPQKTNQSILSTKNPKM